MTLEWPFTQASADVYKAGVLAARLIRSREGVSFYYAEEYLAELAPPIASTLPLTSEVRMTAAGSVPPYFAGLLPEGRRLGALRRMVKTSVDDELSLLIVAGTDTIGDVQVVASGSGLPTEPEAVRLEVDFEQLRFADLLHDLGLDRPPSIAGVQDKLSAAMISVPISRRHERYILKFNPPENPHLVENEHHFLQWSRAARIPTAAARLIRDLDGVPGLLVTRFDRVAGEDRPQPLHVEDAAQALDIWPADKYNVSFEQAASVLMALSSAPLVTGLGLIKQLVFAWLSGNGDQHAKNLSVLTGADGLIRLAPAYDLPSTLFYGDTTLALSVGGRDTLSLPRMRALATELGLRQAAVDRALGEILRRTEGMIDSLHALPFDPRSRDKVARQLVTRRRDLGR